VKVKVYNKQGATRKEAELGPAFEADLRVDVIRKAVNAAQANRRQPYGSWRWAGMLHPQQSVRSGSGISRVPRMTQGNTAVLSPAVVGGRRAHPPKPEKVWAEKINRKEKALAFRSALAATAKPDVVAARGHRFKEGITTPLVVEDGFAGLSKTKDVLAALAALGVGDDLARALRGHRRRPGVGKLRNRPYRTPVSVLLVTHSREGLYAAGRNLRGVEVVTPADVNVERLAPGGDPGRLMIVTESALKVLQERAS